MSEIAIITPIRAKNQNSLQWFHEMLASLAGQTFHDFEVVVIDDRSKEDISPIVEYWMGEGLSLRAFKNKGKGVSAARNTAVEIAQSPLILPVDADDKLTTDALQKLLTFWHENDEPGIVYTDTMFFGQDYQRVYTAHEYDFTKLLQQPLFTVGAMHRKSDWERVGGWRLDMTSGLEIWEYWIALGEIGVCGVRLPEPLYWYRRHAQGRLAWLKSEGQKRYKDAEIRMRELHRDTYNGRYPMGCCGKSVASTKPRAGRSAATLHRQTPTSDLTQMRYVGKMIGGFEISGNVSRVRYVVPGKGALVEQAQTGRPGVLKDDVPWFGKIRGGRDFKVVSRPAPAPRPAEVAKPREVVPTAGDMVSIDETVAEQGPPLPEKIKPLELSNPGAYTVGELRSFLAQIPSYIYPELAEMLVQEQMGKNRKSAVQLIKDAIDEQQNG